MMQIVVVVVIVVARVYHSGRRLIEALSADESMRFFKLFQVEEVGRAAVTVVRVRMNHIRRLVNDTRKGLVGTDVVVFRRHAVAKVTTGRFDIVRL